jgi:hypothetical protein
VFETLVWVVMIGPTTTSGQYAYVVMTDPELKYLRVLATDTHVFQRLYEVDIIGALLDAGFTSNDTKVQIVGHDSACPYPAKLDSYVYPGEMNDFLMHVLTYCL